MNKAGMNEGFNWFACDQCVCFDGSFGLWRVCSALPVTPPAPGGQRTALHSLQDHTDSKSPGSVSATPGQVCWSPCCRLGFFFSICRGLSAFLLLDVPTSSCLAAEHRGNLQIHNVTNEGREMMVPELQEDPEWIELADQYQVFRPEEGPLERRIGVSFEEALFLDENDEAYANQEHQDYWFTLPEGKLG